MSDGWYYNLTTRQVEPASEVAKAADRLGPYATAEEAAKALETLHARNEAYDEEEEAEREDRDPLF